jgi:AAA domain
MPSSNGRLSTDDLIRLVEQRTGRQGRKVGRETALLCPHHETLDSKTPSLHVREGDAGYPIMQCRSAGCTNSEILASLELTWADVFGDEDDHWMPGNRTWVAVYDYQLADGTLEYQVVRAANKEFSQRHPDPARPGKWLWNLNGVTRVPYHLPALIAAPIGTEVFIAEGEKDVQALENAGLVATCNSGGAGKWRIEFYEFFRGRTVTIIADNDEAGFAHALQVYESLLPTATVRVAISPSEKDPHDHFAAGLGVDAFETVTLETLRSRPALEVAQPDEPAATPGGGTVVALPVRPELVFMSGRRFIEQPLVAVEPLLGQGGDGIIMPGSLLLLAGIGGVGKTTLSLHAALHFCAALPWASITLARALRLTLIENEGPHDPFVEKVKRMCDRFHDCTCSGLPPHGDRGEGFMTNATVLDGPWGHFSFDDAGYARALNEHAIEFETDLVMANPLGRLGMKGAGTPEETRAFLALLVNAGLGDAFAAWIVHHMAKGKQMSLSQQISGDWVGHPDTILILESAGQRRSKLTFDKIRWGDQGAREPLLLNWLVDEDGPVGYSMADAPKGIDDTELYERIDAFLREQPEAPGMTAIQQGITGQHKRLKDLIEEGVNSGRYRASTGRRRVFWLAGEGPEQETMDV